jgi:iron(III) transport system permease protein
VSLIAGVPRPLVMRAPRGSASIVWIAALIVAGAMTVPLIYLVVRAAGADADAWNDLLRDSTWRLLRNTVLLAVSVTGASIAISLPIAWLVVRSDLPLRRVWLVLSVLPLVFPTFVGALAYIAAMGPRGTLQGILGPLGVESVPQITGFEGAFLALTLFSYPYLLLTLLAGMRGVDPSMEEASRALGVGAWRTFFRVVVPQLRVPLAAGSLLVALYVVSDFGAVSILRFDTFTRAIFVQMQSSFDRSAAAVLGLELVALVGLILVMEAVTRSRGRYYASGAATPRTPRRTRLGRWRWAALAFLVLLMLAALVTPMAALLDWLIRGLQNDEPIHDLWAGAWRSLWVSAAAAGIAVAAALPVAIVAVRRRGAMAGLVERVSYVGFALPGIVVALSVVFFALNVVPALYQSWFLLIFAYLVLFLPQSIGPLRTSLVRVRPSIEEAARGLGRPRGSVLATVTLPLIVPGMVSGFALVFLTTMKELPATLLLAPIEFDTLATQVWLHAEEAFFARAAAPGLLLIGVAALPMALILIRQRGLRD